MSRPVLLLLLLAALPARAQFADSEVSGPGSAPFLLSADGWSWEDLSASTPGVRYNLYRSEGARGFGCLASGLAENAWSGDAEAAPASGAWWYLVTADDGWRENRAGGERVLAEPCPCGGTEPSPSSEPAVEFVADFVEPVALTSPPGDRTRVHVVERDGRIVVYNLETGASSVFLDIRAQVRTCGEQGLLSMAFHPGFAENGRFFVYYNVDGGAFGEGRSYIAEFTALDADTADPASERVLYWSDRPTCFHAGGQIAFGPHDGMLYFGLGEGDYPDLAQDPSIESGKILRIDVDGAEPYEVPADNPFVGEPGTLPEIWATGVRNPWRFSFDSETGDLYVGDVGDACSEEISVGLAVSGGGENYGWPSMEGFQCPATCSAGCAGCPGVPDCAALTPPVADYPNVSFSTCAVIGGFVYRGCRMPEMEGRYFYSDWCDGQLRSFVLEGGVATDERTWDLGQGGPVAFGEDGRGELYLLTGDAVFRLIPG